MSETTKTVRQVRACELLLRADQSPPHRQGDVYELPEQLAQQLIEQGVVVEESAADATPKGRKRSAQS